jgi:hypothetical protein
MESEINKLQESLATANRQIESQGALRRQYAQRNVLRGLHELVDLGLDLEAFIDDVYQHFSGDYDGSDGEDESGEPLLLYPPPDSSPWSGCHPASRSTVLYMRKRIESTGKRLELSDEQLYDRWVISGQRGDILIAQIKQEIGADLTVTEQLRFRQRRPATDK